MMLEVDYIYLVLKCTDMHEFKEGIEFSPVDVVI